MKYDLQTLKDLKLVAEGYSDSSARTLLYKFIKDRIAEAEFSGERIVERSNYFKGDDKLYKIHHKEESLRLKDILIKKGFTTCGIGDAEGLWMNYSDSYAAGWLGMTGTDEEIYDCIKDQLYTSTIKHLG